MDVHRVFANNYRRSEDKRYPYWVNMMAWRIKAVTHSHCKHALTFWFFDRPTLLHMKPIIQLLQKNLRYSIEVNEVE